MQSGMKQVLVKELMQRKVFHIYLDQTVFDASVMMTSEKIGAVPVLKKENNNGGILFGIITDRDIVTRCIALGKNPMKTKVCECMTANPYRVVPDSTCDDAVKLMAEMGVRRLPVVDKDRLVGFISLSDIARVNAFRSSKTFPYMDCVLIDMVSEMGRASKCLCN